MAHDPFTGRKLFTVEMANAALPLVRAIVSDWSQLSAEVAERSERLAQLRRGRETRREDPYSEELRQVEQDLAGDAAKLSEYIGELEQLGVEPKSGTDGLVDFPAMLEGRPVYLCWKLGEPEVMYWHDLDAGFAGRQSLVELSGAGDGASASDSRGFVGPDSAS